MMHAMRSIHPPPGRIEVGAYWMVDPEICHGMMTLKGTRVTIDVVFGGFLAGQTIDRILEGYMAPIAAISGAKTTNPRSSQPSDAGHS